MKKLLLTCSLLSLGFSLIPQGPLLAMLVFEDEENNAGSSSCPTPPQWKGPVKAKETPEEYAARHARNAQKTKETPEEYAARHARNAQKAEELRRRLEERATSLGLVPFGDIPTLQARIKEEEKRWREEERRRREHQRSELREQHKREIEEKAERLGVSSWLSYEDKVREIEKREAEGNKVLREWRAREAEEKRKAIQAEESRRTPAERRELEARMRRRAAYDRCPQCRLSDDNPTDPGPFPDVGHDPECPYRHL